jgi:hypothetical protein
VRKVWKEAYFLARMAGKGKAGGIPCFWEFIAKWLQVF